MGDHAVSVTNALCFGFCTMPEPGARYGFLVARFPWVVRFGVSNVTKECYRASVCAGAPGGTRRRACMVGLPGYIAYAVGGVLRGFRGAAPRPALIPVCRVPG